MKIEKEQIRIVEFGYKGLSNSVLLEKIYTEHNVASKLKKSDNFYVYELFDIKDEKPLFTFIYNKGFMRGKVFCIFLKHTHTDGMWNTDISDPFIKEGEEWVSGKFRTKARDDEFTNFIQSGEIWKV